MRRFELNDFIHETFRHGFTFDEVHFLGDFALQILNNFYADKIVMANFVADACDNHALLLRSANSFSSSSKVCTWFGQVDRIKNKKENKRRKGFRLFAIYRLSVWTSVLLLL